MSGNKGYIHLYTGNGKGKTTAAIGLAEEKTGDYGNYFDWSLCTSRAL